MWQETFWVNLLTVWPQFFLVGLAMQRTLTIPKPALFLGVITAVPTTIYLLNAYNHGGMNLILLLVNFVVWLCLLLFFAKDKPSVVILCGGVYTAAMVLADLLLSIFYMQFSENIQQTIYRHGPSLFCVRILLLVIMLPLLYLAQRLLKWILRPSAHTVSMLPFFAVPLSQVVLVMEMLYLLQFSDRPKGAVAMAAMTAMVCVAAAVVFFRAIAKMRREQELKEQIHSTERQLAAQVDYYRRLEDHIVEINRIRHDLNNQLQTAYRLLESAETAAARQQLDTVRKTVRTKIGTVYCANLIVDAVLTEKAALAKEVGIGMEIQAELPRALPMESAQLCSAFSNILDNAIVACQACPSGAREITLKTHIKAGSLAIFCENSACSTGKMTQPLGDTLPVHGLGLGILQQLAEQYHGVLYTEKGQDTYKTTLTLCL